MGAGSLRVSYVALIVLAGCITGPQSGSDTAASLAPELPLPPISVTNVARIDLEQPAREPTIAQAPDATLYVAAFWGQYRFQEHLPGSPQNVLSSPLIWKSTDSGKSWSRVDAGTPATGAISNSDIDIAVAPDGTIFVVALSYYRTDVEQRTMLVAGASSDGGGTWKWTTLDQGPYPERPWVETAPDGTAHAFWGHRDIQHATSADRGATWRKETIVHTESTPGGVAIAPDGTLAVRVVPQVGLGPAPPFNRANDGVTVFAGGKWDFRTLPGSRGWAEASGAGSDGTPRAYDPVAFDANGTLYAAWAEGDSMMLATSTDTGVTWNVTLISKEEGRPYYPAMAAGVRGGDVAVTWFTNSSGRVVARLAVGTDDGADGLALRVADFEHDTGGPDHAEFFQVVFLREGGVGAAVPVTRDGQWLEYRIAK